MAVSAAVPVFTVGVIVSLGMSWVLVSRLERVGERLGLSEALLGVVAALAADSPEVTSAISALAHHEQRVGVGVVAGSNVFNLAALLGLSAIVAGRILLHRKVIALAGAVGIWVAGACIAVVCGLVPPAAGLAAVTAVLVPYITVLGVRRDRLLRLPLPPRWGRWLAAAVAEEEREVGAAVRARRGRPKDAGLAAVALLVVVAASVAMERAASALGGYYGIPQIVTGALGLAVITSLPNAVAGVYLAARGRGAAALSTALNSNALNVAVGLLLPATVAGLGRPSGGAVLTAAWYGGLTIFAVACAYRDRGLHRVTGLVIIGGYAAFSASLLVTAYTSAAAGAAIAGLVAAAAGLAWVTLIPAREANAPDETASPAGGQQRDTGQPHRRASHAAPPTLLTGWSVGRLWALSVGLSSLVAAVDAVTGDRIILIGLLIIGPCSAALTGQWRKTAVTGAWATGLAIALGFPDGIWGTLIHWAFLAAVGTVALANTLAAAVIQKLRS